MDKKDESALKPYLGPTLNGKSIIMEDASDHWESQKSKKVLTPLEWEMLNLIGWSNALFEHLVLDSVGERIHTKIKEMLDRTAHYAEPEKRCESCGTTHVPEYGPLCDRCDKKQMEREDLVADARKQRSVK